MVNARLHVVCGNCGNLCTTYGESENMNFEIDPKGKCVDIDGDLRELPAVRIRCKNCSTIHCLEDTVEER